MTTIFTLTEITVNSKSRYPVRKTQERDLGLYSTVANAEAEMKRQAQLELEAERECRKVIAEDEECRQDEKLLGHNVVLAFRIIERELDAPSWGDIQSVRTYTATGDPNDECLLDEMCERHFTGRQPEKIRFQPGDIVEVITSWNAELCVVGNCGRLQATASILAGKLHQTMRKKWRWIRGNILFPLGLQRRLLSGLLLGRGRHPLPPGIAESVPPHKTSAESAARQIESKIRRNEKTLWSVIGDWESMN